MQSLWPRPDFENIPKSLLVLGCLYFTYEAVLLYFLPLVTPGTEVLASAERATLLRDANTVALGFVSLGAFFLFLAAWQPTRLLAFVVVLLVSKAGFFALWYTPAPLAVTLLSFTVPITLLAALVYLAFANQRARRSAP